MSAFDKQSTGEEVSEGIDLSGHVALLTGCTHGVGLETIHCHAEKN